jgi:hypothetical protein
MGDFLNTVLWRVLPHPDNYELLVRHLDGLCADLFFRRQIPLTEQSCRLLRFYFMLNDSEAPNAVVFEKSIYQTENFGPSRPEFLSGLFLGSSLLTSLSVTDLHACLAQSAVNRLLDHPDLLTKHPLLQSAIKESGLGYAATLSDIRPIDAYGRFITALLLLDTGNGGLDISHFINPNPSQAVCEHLKIIIYSPDYGRFDLDVCDKPKPGHFDCVKLVRAFLERKSIMELWANNSRFITIMLNRTFILGTFSHELPEHQTSGPVGLYVSIWCGATLFCSIISASFWR